MSRFARTRILVSVIALGACSATATVAAGLPASAPAEPIHDGAHDFDFNIGTWNTHITRVLNPFAAGSPSVALDGTVTVRPIWNGKAELEEIEADGPKGHWEGLTLFLYNPRAHQWSQSFVNSKVGTLSSSANFGEFKDGRGVLFGQDTVNGRSILVRAEWSNIGPQSHRYQESYSNDGGTTWATSFAADLSRTKPGDVIHRSPPLTERDAQSGGFDYSFGNWREHSKRLLHPLTGDGNWIDMQGSTAVSKIWNGRASIAEFKAEGPAGPLEILALRVYNPVARQWSVDFATSAVGELGAVPGLGEFKNGRIDFFDAEPINGRQTLVRFSCWGLGASRMQTEQAYSADGGKSWEVNWVNQYTRVGE
jgi:hypothetical protein